MKTKTSKRTFLERSFLLLPLLAGLLYGFSTKNTEFKEPGSISSEKVDYKTLEISVDKKGTVKMEGKQVTLAELRKNLKPETFTNYAITASPTAPKQVMEELLQIVLEVRVEGSVTVCSSGGEDPNGTNVVHELFKNVEEQEKATPKMIAEYNQWAKHYKVAGKETMAVVKPVLDRMKYIYSIMTPEQRKKAEPFPKLDPEQVIVVSEDKPTSGTQNSAGDVPLPPPPPPAPTVKKDGDVPPPPPPPPAPEVEEVAAVPAPPPPPPSPVEAMEDWIEEGAKFFYNGKSITGKEALEIVKKNNGKNLQVNVKEDSTGKTVKLFDKKR